MSEPFQAMILHREDKRTIPSIESIDESRLPDGEVVVDVAYSSLNYKDALAVTGKGKVVRSFPIVPGIDLAGTVVSSTDPSFRPGDPVLATGWGLGETTWGGFAQRARLKAGWLVPIPSRLDAKRAMAVGTAGLTAMLCVMRLEAAGLTAEQGPVVVTGAGGGVGSLAAAILAEGGYRVAAVTGRPELGDSLRALGVETIVPRSEMETTHRPLESQRWAGGIDAVGGRILARVLAETHYGGCVASCGLAASPEMTGTVLPFILRNVSLLGVESVVTPFETRREAWDRIARVLAPETLDRLTRSVSLSEVSKLAEEVLAGRVHGRIVVDPSG
ncbi:MAG: acryloyl-CoA reductase [Candidatus Eisenbacteria bacterium]|nr:acryloyl-CoA reductase [Candidatus Latescibacterota bacterium]MBD3301231.1 acryloyl-CoA reductase [Candidatus Eisenbacteria bacterium]